MINRDILKKYGALLKLEKHFPHRNRRKIKRFLSYVLALSALSLILPSLKLIGVIITAALLISWIKLALLELYFYSKYDLLKNEGLSFSLLSLEYDIQTSTKSKLNALINNEIGIVLLARLGVLIDLKILDKETLNQTVTNSTKYEDEDKNVANFIFNISLGNDATKEIFRKHAVSEKQIKRSFSMIETAFDTQIESEKWWSNENLSQIKAIGDDWAHGQTQILERYGRFVSSTAAISVDAYKEEIKRVLVVISKQHSPHAIVIDDSDAGRTAVIEGLNQKLQKDSLDASSKKRIFLIDSNIISQNSNSPQQFESEFSKVLYEAARIGNIICAIDNFPIFLDSTKNIGVEAISLMQDYLKGNVLPFIFLSDSAAYYQKIQPRNDIGQYVELVQIKIKDEEALLHFIEQQVQIDEAGYGVFYTYQAIEAVFDAIHRYFSTDTYKEKALDLINEVSVVVSQSKHSIVLPEDILSVIEDKTGIPAGAISEGEKDKLLNLESLLHARVIGQNEAVVSISQALRRSRSGISKTDRPIGSFLFLGPTGVGKTETTKALSDIFFGETIPLTRFDMSEFSGEDALSRLIGDSHTQNQGLLSNAVRERQYGVLLLDEFEKASKEVHNLFLQILDEGFFSDVFGKHVNVRNMIIIATSNAGSDIIMNSSGIDLVNNKPQIIESIVNRGIFRPELLNRFDGVIFFQSLSEDNMQSVVNLMLKGLGKRLKEKGIELVITPEMVTTLLNRKIDTHFGARPLNRLIADLVEEKVAEGLIAGTIASGTKITFIPNSNNEFDLKVLE